MTDLMNNLINNDLNFLIESKIPLEDVLKITILVVLVKKICKQKGDKYTFSVIDETEENINIVNNCFETIMKLSKSTNASTLRKSKKKVCSLLKFLCKNLKKYGISLKSKHIGIEIDGIKKTRYIHIISNIEKIKL